MAIETSSSSTSSSRSRLRWITSILLVMAVFCTMAPQRSDAESLNRIILRVNDEVVTLHQYELRKEAEIARLLSNPSLSQNQRQEKLEKVGKEVMQTFFSELLLMSFASQQGIRVKDSEVKASIQSMREAQGLGDDAEFLQALKTSGLTLKQLEQSTHRDLIWQQVVGREVQAKVEVGDEELRAYYRNNPDQFRVPEQRWLKELIVLESSGLNAAELQSQAENIVRELREGADFDTLAAEYKEKGITTGVIDLEWLKEGELEESLSKAAWALKSNQYSAPIEGRGGLHILHLAGVEESQVQPFTEVETQIANRERAIRFNQELRKFMKELEKESYVEEQLPPETVGYRALLEAFESDDDLGFLSPLKDQEESAPAEDTSEDGAASETR